MMMMMTVLYCNVLYCAVLYAYVLYFTILYASVMYNINQCDCLLNCKSPKIAISDIYLCSWIKLL